MKYIADIGIVLLGISLTLAIGFSIYLIIYIIFLSFTEKDFHITFCAIILILLIIGTFLCILSGVIK